MSDTSPFQLSIESYESNLYEVAVKRHRWVIEKRKSLLLEIVGLCCFLLLAWFMGKLIFEDPGSPVKKYTLWYYGGMAVMFLISLLRSVMKFFTIKRYVVDFNRKKIFYQEGLFLGGKEASYESFHNIEHLIVDKISSGDPEESDRFCLLVQFQNETESFCLAKEYKFASVMNYARTLSIKAGVQVHDKTEPDSPILSKPFSFNDRHLYKTWLENHPDDVAEEGEKSASVRIKPKSRGRCLSVSQGGLSVIAYTLMIIIAVWIGISILFLNDFGLFDLQSKHYFRDIFSFSGIFEAIFVGVFVGVALLLLGILLWLIKGTTELSILSDMLEVNHHVLGINFLRQKIRYDKIRAVKVDSVGGMSGMKIYTLTEKPIALLFFNGQNDNNMAWLKHQIDQAVMTS